MNYREKWMSDDQYECATMLADLFGGFHHLNKIKSFGFGIAMTLIGGDLATYDFNILTRAVILAHDRCIRFSVGTAGMKLQVHLFKRSREGMICERHPTIEEAIASERNK